MQVIPIIELGQGGESVNYVNAGIYATGQGRTLSITNPDTISINVMMGVDKTNWELATMNGADLIVTSATIKIPVNNYSQWIQLQAADGADISNVVAQIL